jgi:tRNA (mo5U34)-methyltransferase
MERDELVRAIAAHSGLVLLLGVLYHLRNPMLAFDRIRAVQQPGGALFVESQLATSRGAASSSEPLWEYLPRDSMHGDATNKWAPNLAGLTAVVEDCLYRVARTGVTGDRGWVRAVAIEDRKLAFFRALDAAKGWWGRMAAP